MRARGRPPLAPIGAWPDPVDVDPGRLEFATEPAPHEDCVALFSVDGQLEYDAFNRDFGPLSLGCLLQFCRALDAKLASTQSSQQRVRFVMAAGSPARLANAVTLLAGWRVIRCGAHDAGSALSPFPSTLLARLPGYRDAGVASEDSFPLSVRDVVAGLARAVHTADPLLDPSALDVRAFHWLARPENGDLSWVAPDLIAFRGPIGDYVELDPDAQPAAFYVPYFQSHRVALVVRLNVEPRYDSRVFTSAGIDHLDLSFPDGAAPSAAAIATFLAAYDRTRPGVVAVHCAAGLGRTGTMLAAGFMAKRGFSAREAVGWLRLCRPGSVLGSQVRFLEQELAPRLRISNTTAKLDHGEHPKSATATKSLVASKPLPTVRHYYVR